MAKPKVSIRKKVGDKWKTVMTIWPSKTDDGKYFAVVPEKDDDYNSNLLYNVVTNKGKDKPFLSAFFNDDDGF